MTGDELARRDHHPDPYRGERVADGTARRIRDAVPENTRRSYERALRAFTTWCTEQHRLPFPTSAAVLADYVAHLADENKAPNTIRHDMGAINKQNVVLGHPHPGKDVTTAANLVLRGHSVDRSNQGYRVQQAPPITRERLRQMTAACDRSTLAGRRDRLLLVLGWALAGRRSELVALTMQDIQPDHESGVEVLIRKSKTDKTAQGEIITVPPGEHVDTDPIGLLQDWTDMLGSRGVDTHTGPLLRAVTQHDRLYQHRGLTAQAVNNIVKRIAKRAGLPNASQYSAHSLRAGFATQAAMDGIAVPLWAEHGRWDKTSPVPLGYVRAADRKRDNPLKRMGL